MLQRSETGPKYAEDYRAFVGPEDGYDRMSAMQFNLLTFLGLREDHYLLDIGCGSLRAGRLFIPYLKPGRYFGIEPEARLLEQGIDKEAGRSLIEVKRPSFSSNAEFELSVFDQQFDFIIAQSIFSHTAEWQIRKCLAEAKTVMKPDARFAVSYFEGRENYSGDRWAVVATYTRKRMTELAEEAGLHCEPLDWPHTDRQTWILITHRERQKGAPELSSTARILQLEAHLDDLKRQRDLVYNHPWTKLGTKLHFFKIYLDFKTRGLMSSIRRQHSMP